MASQVTNQQESKILFISHINEEVEIALAMKKELERYFGSHIKVFLSESIPFGEDWQRSIYSTLQQAKLILVLFSPESVERPWINVEAGYGIISGKTVIPVYCFGLDQDKLHYLYQRLMGIDIDEPSSIKRLLKENIATELLKISLNAETLEHWVDSWRDNVEKAVTNYFNEKVIKIKLPFQCYFHLFNDSSNRCLDVFNWRKDEKAPIIGYALHGGNNQLWQLKKADGTYFRIGSKHSKMCLGISPDAAGEVISVEQYKYTGDMSQQWDVTQISNDDYKIGSCKHPDLCLTIEPTKDPNVSGISLRRWGHHWEQRWLFKITSTVVPV